eukprot:g1291.t1
MSRIGWKKSTPTAPVTKTKVLFDEQALYFGFEVESGTLKKNAGRTPSDEGKWASENGVPREMVTLLEDDRCECFLWPVKSASDRTYYAFEVTRSGRAVTSETKFHRNFNFTWKGAAKLLVNKSTGPLEEKGGDDGKMDAFVFAVRLEDELSPESFSELRAGFYRGTREDRLDGAFSWASWVDPSDDQVDFHRPETFGVLRFEKRDDGDDED